MKVQGVRGHIDLRSGAYVKAIAVASIILGCVFLAGWLFHIKSLTSPQAGVVLTKANAAVLFIASGLWLWLSAKMTSSVGRGMLVAARLLALGTFAIGTFTLTEYIFGINTGIDCVLTGELAEGNSGLVRMAPNSTVCFVLLGLAQLMSYGKRLILKRMRQGLLLAVVLISLVAIVGYAYGASPLYAIGYCGGMSLPTAGMLFALALGILLSCPFGGLMPWLASGRASAIMVRRLLPAAVILPAAAGWLRLLGQRAGFYSAETGLAFLVATMIVSFGVVILVTARVLTRQEEVSLALEEKVARDRELLSMIIDNIADGVMVADQDGKIILRNAAANTFPGVRDLESLPQSQAEAPELFLPDGTAPYPVKDLPLSRAISGQEVNDEELCIRQKGRAEPQFVSVNGRPLKDEAGTLIGGVIVWRDVTRQRLSEEQSRLLLIMEQREDFMATLTHDLKNPLIGANRILELFAEGSLGSLTAEQSELLLKLRDSNKSLLTLIQNLIEVYRYERDIHTIHFEDTNLGELVSDCVEQVVPIADNRGIAIKCDLPADKDTVLADKSSIRRVLQNLLDNAAKFTPDGGLIKVAVRPGCEQVSVDVENSGPGISPEDAEQLFKRFAQGTAGKKYLPGTGLGLYLCKQIVQAHQGEISCSSRQDVSTIFTVSLPVRRVG